MLHYDPQHVFYDKANVFTNEVEQWYFRHKYFYCLI